MNTLLKKSAAVFATAAILASTSVTAFAASDAPAVTTEPAGNYDKVVWIGAKDVKARKDVDKFPTLMKSETYNYVGAYSGGKMAVAVLKTGTAARTANDFAALVDNKGKLQKAAADEGKKIASAKYKDGSITVTAGKEPGAVEVWVYELKKDGKDTKVVNASLVSGAGKAADATGTVAVAPAKEDFTVKAAMTGPQFLVGTLTTGTINQTTVPTTGITAPKGTGTDLAGTIAKSDKVVNLSIQGTTNSSATIYIADKKAEVAGGTTGGNTFTIASGEAAGAYDTNIIQFTGTPSVAWDATNKVFKLEGITAKGAGKTTITITNNQSGKSLKVPVVVTKYAKVSLSGTGTVNMSVDGGTAAALTTTGTYVAPKSKVTFSVKVKVGGKEIEVGKAVTINADTTVEVVTESAS